MRSLSVVSATIALAAIVILGGVVLSPSASSDSAVVEARDAPARSGCCSWHGGVCGCLNGRAKCCDGTLSPSCGCD